MPIATCFRPRLPHKKVHLRLIRLLAFAALAVGCSEPTAPGPFSGTFSLRLINQASLPSIQGTFSGAPIVLADAMAFSDSIPSPGMILFTRSSTVQYPGRAMEQFQLRYEAAVRGDTLDIFECPLGAICTANAYPPLLGVLRGDTLRLLERPLYGGIGFEQLFVRTR